MWNLVITVSFLITSYIYTFIAAFGNNEYKNIKFFEMIFCIDIIINFFTEIPPLDESEKPERRIKVIVKAYLKGEFILDFLPIIPFDWMVPERDRIHRLLYLFKIIRLKRGLRLFNANKIMLFVKKMFKDQLLYVIEKKPDLSNDFNQDNNNIGVILAISHLVKSFRLVVIIFNFSYFIGMLWIIICQYYEDFEEHFDQDGNLIIVTTQEE